MPPHQLDSLRERLLRGGVAPRHVRRYLRELRDHFDDALRAELAQNPDERAARDAVWARLGNEESLAKGMLEQPELRSRAARFPRFFFGALPVIVWLGTPVVVFQLLSLLEKEDRDVKVGAVVIAAFHALCLFYMRVVPVLSGALLLEVAARRRLRARWPLIGAGVVQVLAGTATVESVPGQLSITSSLLPWLAPFPHLFGPRSWVDLAEGLLRAACLFALGVIAQRLARRLWSSDRPVAPAG